MIPNVVLFYLLAASAIAFPMLAAFSMVGSGIKHPVFLVLAHLFMGASQLYFGLLPLIS